MLIAKSLKLHKMIRFRMTKIAVEQFAILAEAAPEGGNISLSISLGFQGALDAGMVACIFGIEFLDAADSPLLKLSTRCEFGIHPSDWEAMSSGSIISVSKQLQEFLATQTIGTARGIMHCKTEGSPFNNLILPPIDVTQLVEEDITFEKTEA